MLTLASVPGTDDWWLIRLATELGAGFPRLRKLQRYRTGDAPIPDTANHVTRASMVKFMSMARLNFAEQLVVSSTGRERPLGFRTAAPSDANGDPVADRVWNTNHMAVQFRDLLDAKATYGRAYITVTGQQQNVAPFSMPTMLWSTPWNTRTRPNPLRPWEIDHAIYIGHDEVFNVDTITYFRAAQNGQPAYFRQAYRRVLVSTIPTDGTIWYPGNDWAWASDPIPFGFTNEVPMVEFATPGGIGEFELHLDSLDRINHTILQRLIITAMQAFRTRALQPDGANAEPIPEFYPEDDPLGRGGQKINYDEVYEAGPAALWFLPIGSKVWESAVTDIRPIIEATKEDLKMLASASSTPIHVLSPDAANGSAEGANLSRETNLTKVLDRIDRDTNSLARGMSFSMQALRDTVRADPTQIQTLWAPLDFSTIEQKALATYNAARGGMSKTFIGEKIWALGPGELQQETLNAIEDALNAAAAAPSTAA